MEFYVGLALRARGQARGTREEAFVIRTFRNGLAVFVSAYARFHSLQDLLTIAGWDWRVSLRSTRILTLSTRRITRSRCRSLKEAMR